MLVFFHREAVQQLHQVGGVGGEDEVIAQGGVRLHHFCLGEDGDFAPAGKKEVGAHELLHVPRFAALWLARPLSHRLDFAKIASVQGKQTVCLTKIGATQNNCLAAESAFSCHLVSLSESDLFGDSHLPALKTSSCVYLFNPYNLFTQLAVT